MDKNYTNKQNEILKNITKEEVNQQIKKHFDSNKLTTVVVGDKYIIESLLEKASKDANNKEVLNKVKLKKISIIPNVENKMLQENRESFLNYINDFLWLPV